MLGVGADQRREEQPAARQALGRADRADDAVDLVALAGAGRRNGGRDVTRATFFVSFNSARPVRPWRVAHDRHDLAHAADRGQVAGVVAGAFEPDDHAQALDRVLFLPLDAADAFERQPGGVGARRKRRATNDAARKHEHDAAAAEFEYGDHEVSLRERLFSQPWRNKPSLLAPRSLVPARRSLLTAPCS